VDSYCGRAHYRSFISARHTGQTLEELISCVPYVHILCDKDEWETKEFT